MFKDLYTLLQAHNPYPPGKHAGLCEKPYLVIREGYTTPLLETNKLGNSVIDIILFVPLESYIEMKIYRAAVVNTLKNYLRKTGMETPIIPDDDKKAYTMSVEYILQRRLEE